MPVKKAITFELLPHSRTEAQAVFSRMNTQRAMLQLLEDQLRGILNTAGEHEGLDPIRHNFIPNADFSIINVEEL